MSVRDEIIVIQAVTNSIKVDIKDCIENGDCDLVALCMRLDTVVGDMQMLIDELDEGIVEVCIGCLKPIKQCTGQFPLCEK